MAKIEKDIMAVKIDTLALKRDFSDRELQLLQMELSKSQKNALTAYLLWFFLGLIGIHRFYLGRTKALLNLFIYGFIAFFSVMFLTILSIFVEPLETLIENLDNAGAGMLLILPFFWIFLDVFRIPSMVKEKNDEIELQLIKKIKSNRVRTQR